MPFNTFNCNVTLEMKVFITGNIQMLEEAIKIFQFSLCCGFSRLEMSVLVCFTHSWATHVLTWVRLTFHLTLSDKVMCLDTWDVWTRWKCNIYLACWKGHLFQIRYHQLCYQEWPDDKVVCCYSLICISFFMTESSYFY